jgi:hypothetical protein
MDSYDVRFWDIRKLGNGGTARFRVRWAVGGREHCKSFKGRRPRPWTKPDTYGRIADGRGPGRHLQRRMCWSAAWTPGKSDGL